MPEPVHGAELEPRQRLLLAAEEVFARRGFDGATVRDICDRAGMNVAAVNYHFGDKESLYIEACKAAHTCSGMGEPPDFPADMPPAEKLRLFVGCMAAWMMAPVRPTAMQLLMREMAQASAATRAVVAEFIQRPADRLRAIVREVVPTADEPTVYMIGFSVIGQLLYYRQNRPVSELLFGADVMATLTPDRVATHVTRFTLAALGLADPYPGVRT
jgi:AcrR family transcriptional regulator